MKNILYVLLVFFTLYSCSKKKEIELVFLDEFVVKDSLTINNSFIGGLSGIDYSNGFFYFVIDDAWNPRFVKANINIEQNKIKSVDFKKVVYLNDTTTAFYNENVLDLESIFIDNETQEVNFVSEGSINRGKRPSVFTTDSLGNFMHSYIIPDYFIPNAIVKLKHNGAFEGSSKGVKGKGFWVAMESPLIVDGDEPTFKETSSPIRITFFDKKLKKATKQYAYQLEHITKPSKGDINLNGLTSILEYKENHFFIIERTYQSGYEAYGNIIRIFDVSVDETTTNVLDIESLKKTKFIPLKKRLVFDFENIRSELTEGIVDNIEGLTFGPKLSNGNQSLVLVSDDNFQLYGKQLNQFILLEIKNKLMNLSNLKESRLRKKFDKTISKLQENRVVSQKEILTVGILTTEAVSSKIDVQSEIEAILGLKNSKIYSFKKFNKSDEVSFKYFSEKDINWKGVFVEPTFQSFLEQPFDLLIGYFNQHHLYLEKAVLESKASFKAGFSEVNSKLYELEISTELENVQQFSSELKKYLQILKKLKN